VSSQLQEILAPANVERLRLLARSPNSIARPIEFSDRTGVESLLIFSFNDGGLDMIERYLGSGARKMRGRHNFVLEIVDDADHTFAPRASQVAVRNLIVKAVRTKFP
jgi:hypothetical protein